MIARGVEEDFEKSILATKSHLLMDDIKSSIKNLESRN